MEHFEHLPLITPLLSASREHESSDKIYEATLETTIDCGTVRFHLQPFATFSNGQSHDEEALQKSENYVVCFLDFVRGEVADNESSKLKAKSILVQLGRCLQYAGRVSENALDINKRSFHVLMKLWLTAWEIAKVSDLHSDGDLSNSLAHLIFWDLVITLQRSTNGCECLRDSLIDVSKLRTAVFWDDLTKVQDGTVRFLDEDWTLFLQSSIELECTFQLELIAMLVQAGVQLTPNSSYCRHLVLSSLESTPDTTVVAAKALLRFWPETAMELFLPLLDHFLAHLDGSTGRFGSNVCAFSFNDISARSLLNTLDSLCSNTETRHTNGFLECLSLSASILRESQKNAFRQIAGRVYLKVSRSKVLTFSNRGLSNFTLLMLLLARFSDSPADILKRFSDIVIPGRNVALTTAKIRLLCSSLASFQMLLNLMGKSITLKPVLSFAIERLNQETKVYSGELIPCLLEILEDLAASQAFDRGLIFERDFGWRSTGESSVSIAQARILVHLRDIIELRVGNECNFCTLQVITTFRKFICYLDQLVTFGFPSVEPQIGELFEKSAPSLQISIFSTCGEVIDLFLAAETSDLNSAARNEFVKSTTTVALPLVTSLLKRIEKFSSGHELKCAADFAAKILVCLMKWPEDTEYAKLFSEFIALQISVQPVCIARLLASVATTDQTMFQKFWSQIDNADVVLLKLLMFVKSSDESMETLLRTVLEMKTNSSETQMEIFVMRDHSGGYDSMQLYQKIVRSWATRLESLIISDKINEAVLFRKKIRGVLSAIRFDAKSVAELPSGQISQLYKTISLLFSEAPELLYTKGLADCPLPHLLEVFVHPKALLREGKTPLPRAQIEEMRTQGHLFLMGLVKLLRGDALISRKFSEVVSYYCKQFPQATPVSSFFIRTSRESEVFTKAMADALWNLDFDRSTIIDILINVVNRCSEGLSSPREIQKSFLLPMIVEAEQFMAEQLMQKVDFHLVLCMKLLPNYGSVLLSKFRALLELCLVPCGIHCANEITLISPVLANLVTKLNPSRIVQLLEVIASSWPELAAAIFETERLKQLSASSPDLSVEKLDCRALLEKIKGTHRIMAVSSANSCL